MAEDPRVRRVSLPERGGEMAVLDFGPPDRPVDVVFSQANGFNARTYRTVLAPIDDLRILAPDLRGHGRSTLPTRIEGREGWNQFRDDLLALLAAETSGPVILAGHSMGGTSSLLAAAREPDRVRALALFEPVLLPPHEADPSGHPLVVGAQRRRATYPDRESAADAYRGRGAFATWTDEQILDYVTDGFVETNQGVTLSCPPEWEASNFRIDRHDPWDALAQTTCPVRILKGDRGSTAHTHLRPGLMADPRIRVQTIAGATHFLPLERPDVVRTTLRELIGRSDGEIRRTDV